MFQWNKDAIAVAAENDSKYEPIPAGSILRVMINTIDDKENTSGTGKNLKPEFEVIEGPYVGRKIWENYSYENPSLKAMEIAWRQIRALAVAVFGDDAPRALEQFNGRVLKVKTKNETYNEKVNTKISAYYSDSETPAAVSKVVAIQKKSDSDVPF